MIEGHTKEGAQIRLHHSSWSFDGGGDWN